MLSKIAPCFFAIIIDALGFGLVYPVIATMFTVTNSPVLPADVSISTRHFYLGVAYMLYPLFMLFGSSFLGDLSDRLGRKKVLLVCMIGIAVSFLLMALGVHYDTLFWLFAGRALSGLMAGSQPIAQATIADISDEHNKAFNMSMISLSYSFGLVIGPLVGGIISDVAISSWFSFSTPFLVSCLLAIIAAFWISISLSETAPIAAEGYVSLLRPLQIFVEAFKHDKVRILAAVFFLMQMGFSLYFQFIIIHMRDVYHYSNWEMGAVQGMLGLGFAIGLLIGMPILLKRLSVYNIALISLFLTGAMQLLSTLIGNAEAQWVIAILVAVFDIMAFSSMLTLFSDSVSNKEQGWVMGVTGAVMAIAWVITGLSSNLLLLLTASELIAIGGVLLILSAVLILLSKFGK